MIGQYKGFIQENIAPPNVSTISIYDNDGVKRASMAVPSFMKYPEGEKLYSFGVISDSHIVAQSNGYLTPYPSLKLDNALTWFEEQGASFVCHSGDITNHGFYNSDGTTDLTQFAEYKRICDRHPNFPVYAACGNHDSYFTTITSNLNELEEYTGHGLYYTIPYQNDLFIVIGQPNASTPMGDDAFEWLKATLAANNGKRCFIFVHPFINNDSGNALNVYGSGPFASWKHIAEFKTLLSQYKTILLHGHSHIKFSYQEIEKTATYTNQNGFCSMHIPSIAAPADIINNERIQSGIESQGFLVDVFSDCIVFRGRDFGTVIDGVMTDAKWIPISTYKIDLAEHKIIEVYHSITNNLTNCTNNNATLSILNGNSYDAKITVNDGFELSSITVTMGGNDISASVVKNNTITISKVTGDIVITAVAEQPALSGNLIPQSTDANGNQYVGTNGEIGYKTGYRLSTSAGTESSASGTEVTGFIPAKYGDTIYIKGIIIMSDNSNHNICFYDSSKQYIAHTGMRASTFFGDATDGKVVDGSITDKTNANITDTSDIAYIRISAGVIDDNSILTVNEPINN